MNWNAPTAVERGFLTLLRPPDSAPIRRSRNVSNSADGAASAISFAIDLLAKLGTSAANARAQHNRTAQATLRFTDTILTFKVSPQLQFAEPQCAMPRLLDYWSVLVKAIASSLALI